MVDHESRLGALEGKQKDAVSENNLYRTFWRVLGLAAVCGAVFAYGCQRNDSTTKIEVAKIAVSKCVDPRGY